MSETTHLLLWAVSGPPVVVLDLLKLVKFYSDVIDGELQQVPEPSKVLRGGSRHGTGVLKEEQERGTTPHDVDNQNTLLYKDIIQH